MGVDPHIVVQGNVDTSGLTRQCPAQLMMRATRSTRYGDLAMQWHDDRATRTVYGTDNSIYQLAPERVAMPASAAEIANALAANFRRTTPKPIVARGGGTGTNGQSLTSGLMIDLKRNLHELITVDPERRIAVVEPGLVTAELNEALAANGLFWAPHTSTLNRATVGGMISTDAAGKGSLVHGRAHRHVARLVVLLDDGTEWIAEPVTEAEAQRRAAGEGRGAALWQALIDISQGAVAADLGLPELARGFSGYGVDRLLRSGIIDPVQLLCGAEGTLGIVVEATLLLTPLPKLTRLVVASYNSFGEALEDAVELRDSGPSAIETFDETTLDSGRSSPAWPALGDAIGDHRGAVLLIEYTDDSAGDLDAILGALADTRRSTASAVIDDPTSQAAVWKVRADAVGLLAKQALVRNGRSERPTAFVEDCAVPVQAMAQFIADFRTILDDAGLVYAMFGHADVGCVHVRPALDLNDAEHRDLVYEITARVVELVTRHGGIVWGEHGRGFRGAHVDEILPEPTLALMRRVKTAFDPNDIFNPGKLYRPTTSPEPLINVDQAPMRGTFNGEVSVELRESFADAFACNGNGLCHHYSVNEPMCPSYKATGDPALSPKGRVDLLRDWLRDDSDPDFGDAIADNLDQCLSCSACSGHCPVEVDIPELKSRFFDRYYRKKRRPFAHHLLSHFERAAMVAGRFSRVARLGLKPISRILGLVDLPAPPRADLRYLPVFDPAVESACDVVVMPDVFTAGLEPATLRATVNILTAVGYNTSISSFVPSGKFDHVKGRRQRFAAATRKQAQLVSQVASSGAVAVTIEPAVALLHDHEYPVAVPGYPSGQVGLLAQLLADRSDRLPQVGAGRRVRLLGHCTERALAPHQAELWATVLRAAGFEVNVAAVGCCGMAGIFGHESGNSAMSESLWDLSWKQAIEVDPGVALAATGYSCRSQATRFGETELVHPIHLLVDQTILRDLGPQ